MNSAELMVGFFCGLVILGAFIWLGVVLFLAYTRMDEVLEHLKNCTAVTKRLPLLHSGPLGKLLLMGGISGIVTFPGIYLKHGGVSIEDLQRFPPELKGKFAVLQWTAIGIFFSMAVLVTLGKSGWLK